MIIEGTNLFSKVINKNNKRADYLFYSLIFIISICVYFAWALFTDYTLIDDSDCLSQHYKAFVYYGKYLRSLLASIFIKHTFILPQFDITIGEGSDIIQTLCYYCIGDPFALLSVFAPPEKAYAFFGFMNFARLYAAGLAFVFMCHYFNHKNTLAILAGSCCYIFMPFALENIASQVFFTNPLIFLPLFIVGINKILNKENPLLYIFTVFFTSISNLYFFYMLVVLVVSYGIIKALLIYKNNFKSILFFGLKCLAFAILAMLMAGFLLLPILYIFTHDSRATDHSLKLFYSVLDYAKMPFSLTSCYGNPGWGIHTIFALFILFTPLKWKADIKDKTLRVLFILMCFCIVFPFMSQILNGFSYPTTRWMFAFYLLTSYIVVYVFDKLPSVSPVKAVIFFVLNTFYCFSIAAVKNGSVAIHLCSLAIQSGLGIIFLCLAGLFNKQKINAKPSTKRLSIFLFILASTCAMNMIYRRKDNTIDKATALKTIFDNEATRAKTIAKNHNIEDFFRFSQKGVLERRADNIGPIAGLSSTQYYWSLSNSNIVELRNQLNVIDGKTCHYHGVDARPILMDLANTLYFCQQEEQTIPPLYNFEQTEDKNIYKNKDFLPFGYTYSLYAEKSDWEKLGSIEKELILSKAVVLDQQPRNIARLTAMETGVTNADFLLESDTKELEVKENNIISKKENSLLKINTHISGNNIVFLNFNSLDFKKSHMPEWTTVYVKTNTGYSTTFELLLPSNPYYIYSGIDNYLLNLGYFTDEQPLTDITLAFSDEGTYNFKELNLICMPMSSVSKEIKALGEDTLQNVKMRTNSISGEITLSKPKILCLSIPYLKGWKAFVDGVEQELLHANVQYMALELTEGEHTVNLSYHTPFLKEGLFVSILGWILFAAFLILRIHKSSIALTECE